MAADWNKIKKEYIAGNVTYKELSEKYNVSFSSLEKLARREKWRELRRKANEKTANDVVRAVSKRNAKLDTAIDLALKAACEYLRTPGQMRAVDLKDVTTALKNLRDLKGIKNEADAEEQRARIEALRARTAASKVNEGDEDDGGGVIMLSEVDEPPREVDDGA